MQIIHYLNFWGSWRRWSINRIFRLGNRIKRFQRIPKSLRLFIENCLKWHFYKCHQMPQDIKCKNVRWMYSTNNSLDSEFIEMKCQRCKIMLNLKIRKFCDCVHSTNIFIYIWFILLCVCIPRKEPTFEENHVYRLIARVHFSGSRVRARPRPAYFCAYQNQQNTYFHYYSHFRTKNEKCNKSENISNRIMHLCEQFRGEKKKHENRNGKSRRLTRFTTINLNNR